MALATAWCNVSDQGQAKVKAYCFFDYSGERKKYSGWNIASKVFRRGVTEERKHCWRKINAKCGKIKN